MGVSVVALLSIGAFIAFRLSQESQQDLSPDSSFAYWCAGDSQCPASWRTGNTTGCEQGLYRCEEPVGGGNPNLCDNWANIGETHCNTSLNRQYQCMQGGYWQDTGRDCQGQVVGAPPNIVCGDGRCEGSENSNTCTRDCGVAPGGNGTNTYCSGQTVLSCATYSCPNGDTNSDGQCTFADVGAIRETRTGSSCPTPSSACGQIDYYNTADGALTGNGFCDYEGSFLANCTTPPTTPPPTTPPPVTPPPPAATPYCGDGLCQAGEACERVGAPSNNSTIQAAACSGATGAAPTGQSVASCYGLELNQPDTASTCQFCGDNIYTPGREQCDPTAPAGNGNNPTQCNSNCQLQQTVSQCIDLQETGVDPINTGVGNTIIYTLVYQNPSTSNPYPNIRLRVGPSGSPVGRDANNTSSALVSVIPSTGYSFDSVTLRHTYRFRWEAATTGGAPITDGTYTVRVMLDGVNDIASPADCLETIQAQSTAEEQPLFSIVKQANPVCVENGNIQINYTITATNIGPVTGVIDFIRDTIDTNLVAASIVPTNIDPNFGSYSNGVITWTGTVNDRTFTSGQSRQYTFRITIPSAQIVNFSAEGVLNQVLVQYDTSTTNDNIDSFEIRTPASCSTTSIPETGIFDDGRFLLFGILFTIVGILIYRSDIFVKIQRPLVVGRK